MDHQIDYVNHKDVSIPRMSWVCKSHFAKSVVPLPINKKTTNIVYSKVLKKSRIKGCLVQNKYNLGNTVYCTVGT